MKLIEEDIESNNILKIYNIFVTVLETHNMLDL